MSDISRQTYPFSLPDLPYPFDALEPHIDSKTLRIHHDEHHASYVKKLNEALKADRELHGLTLAQLLRDIDKLPAQIQTAVRNNGGGHLNHALFWRCLSATPVREPRGSLLQAIDGEFGSFSAFRTQFAEVALKHFASGWVALSQQRADGKLAIVDLKDHEVVPPEKATTLLILDVWEHAYYVKYQHRRAEFIEAFWKVLDWGNAAEGYERGRSSPAV
jgi:Fe-Mn family superoxide dismutase